MQIFSISSRSSLLTSLDLSSPNHHVPVAPASLACVGKIKALWRSRVYKYAGRGTGQAMLRRNRIQIAFLSLSGPGLEKMCLRLVFLCLWRIKPVLCVWVLVSIQRLSLSLCTTPLFSFFPPLLLLYPGVWFSARFRGNQVVSVLILWCLCPFLSLFFHDSLWVTGSELLAAGRNKESIYIKHGDL